MNGSLYITNPDGEQPHGCRDLFFGYLLGLLLAAIIFLCLGGCKTVQVSEKVNLRDSTVIHYKDSTIFNIRDSVHLIEQHVTLQDSSHIIIQFGEGGGTYNAQTGEATNVAGIQHTSTHHEQRDSIAHYRNLAAEYEHRADSLSIACQLWQSDYERAEKNSRTSYDRFCSTWFWITAILLLIKVAAWVMEKFPATAPYIAIIRKFVPFL